MIKIWRPFSKVWQVHTAGWEDAEGGVSRKAFTPSPVPLKTSVKSFGGTETKVNDVVVVEDTLVVQSPYRGGLAAGDRLSPWPQEEQTPSEFWEIIGPPEDIENRHRFLMFKIRKIEGGA